MALWNPTGGHSRHPLAGHGMLPPVARGTPAPKVLLARSLLSQLTDSLLRSRRGASVFSIPGGNRERFADICEPDSALTVQRQRKRPGGALGSRPARKRSRLLPSSAGGTSRTEPIDLEESGAPAFEPEIIDLTGEDIIDLTGDDVIDLTGEDIIDLTGDDVIDLTGDEVIDLTDDDIIDLTGEDVIDLTDEDTIDLTGDEVIDLTGDDVIDLTGDEVIDLTGDDVIDLTGEDVIDLTGDDVIDLTGDEVIDLTGDDIIDLTREEVIDLTDEDVIDLTGEEVIDLTGEDVIDLTGESSEPEVITISDDESPVDREQSQQQPHLSRASEDSVEPLARNDEEEPIEDDDDWLRFNFERPFWSDEDSVDREQNQQHSRLSRSTENSPGPVATRDEEEPRDSDGSINSDEWPDRFESPPTWRDDITD
ncbi:coiled-coil domain-containing protein 1-like [Serinus canaria]|uniref:coiled-coil domain-containing protein 1-like n=1 Tax=Serinus canaria TaxID=9135 RepID=UPI0021CCFCC8|nr:coiled-coil domain-containing protein 1-like [Serinus canaria]